jgi:hypothetical protein
LDDLAWCDDERHADYDNPDLEELDWGDERHADYDNPDLDAVDWWLDAVMVVAERFDICLYELLDFISLESCCHLDESVCEAANNFGSCEDLATSFAVCFAAHIVSLALQADCVDACLNELLAFISLEICCKLDEAPGVAACSSRCQVQYPPRPRVTNARFAKQGKLVGLGFSAEVWQAMMRNAQVEAWELSLGRSLDVVPNKEIDLYRDGGWQFSHSDLIILFGDFLYGD